MNTSAFPGQTLEPLPANSGPVGDDGFSLWQKICQAIYNASQGPPPALTGEYLTPDSLFYYASPDGSQYYQQP